MVGGVAVVVWYSPLDVIKLSTLNHLKVITTRKAHGLMICDYKQLTETLEVPGITAREVMALYSNVVIALKDSAVCVVAKEMAPSLVRTTKTTHFVIALTVVDVTNVHMDIYEYNPIIVKGEN